MTPDAATLDALRVAHEKYSKAVKPSYDEVLHEVAERVAGAGSFGKVDIGALLLWKRLRADTPWAMQLNNMTDIDVRAVTAPAVAHVASTSVITPEAAGLGRGALSALPGFVSGDALASALLVAAAPERFAIYDRRAHASLAHLGIHLTNSPRRYQRYMEIVEDLRAAGDPRRQSAWTARDVDLALYWLAG